MPGRRDVGCRWAFHSSERIAGIIESITSNIAAVRVRNDAYVLDEDEGLVARESGPTVDSSSEDVMIGNGGLIVKHMHMKFSLNAVRQRKIQMDQRPHTIRHFSCVDSMAHEAIKVVVVRGATGVIVCEVGAAQVKLQTVHAL